MTLSLRSPVGPLLAVLAGCAPDATLDASLPPPLPTPMALVVPPLVLGETTAIVVTGAAPNARLNLVIAPGGRPGAGVCPPFLQGLCVGFVTGPGGAVVPIPATADGSGRAYWRVPVPSTAPVGLPVAMQVVDVSNLTGSNVAGGGTTLPACADDGSEDNDGPAQATLNPSLLAGRVACLGDDDYYAFDVLPGESLSVEIAFDDAGDGDVDLLLLDSGGSTLDSSETRDDVEQVAWVNQTAGAVRVYAHVFLFAENGGSPGATYDIRPTRRALVTCAPDGLEPNDTNGAAIAPGAYVDLSVCDSAPFDFYTVSVQAGEHLDVLARFDDDDGDIDLFLLDARPPAWTIQAVQPAKIQGSQGSSDTEVLSYTATTSGDLWVVVYLYPGGADPVVAVRQGNRYDLDISLQ